MNEFDKQLKDAGVGIFHHSSGGGAGLAYAAAVMTAHIESLGVEKTFHFISDELVSTRHVVPAGVLLVKDIHPYDHCSALVSGTVRLTLGDAETEVSGPHMLLIRAGIPHSIVALTPVVWHCLHIDSEASAT